MTEETQTALKNAILIVDDEAIVLSALKETLERAKYHVVACSSPRKALEVLKQQDFAVIISDQKMPEMLGLDFLIESRIYRPEASRILITAVLALPTIVDAINKVRRVPADSEFVRIARALGLRRGAAVLRILRCFYDGTGRLFEISLSHHPGERFAYSMHIDHR